MSARFSEACLSACRRYMKHKRDDGAEKQDEETVDVTPIMISVFVVMCCSMLVLLYFFYDRLGTTDTHNVTLSAAFLSEIRLKLDLLFSHQEINDGFSPVCTVYYCVGNALLLKLVYNFSPYSLWSGRAQQVFH